MALTSDRPGERRPAAVAVRPGARLLWPAGAIGLLAGTLIAILILPGALDEKLMALLAGICPQRPSHSIFLGGRPLPLEARMAGIFAGVSVGWAVRVLGRCRIGAGAAGWPIGLAAVFLIVMGLDGANAVAHDLGLPAAYPPDNGLRLATGLLAGLGLVWVLGPILASVWSTAGTAEATRPAEVAGALAAVGVLFVAFRSGWGVLLDPAAVIVTAGVIGLLAGLNAVGLLIVARRDCGGGDRRERAGWLAIAGSIAVLELIGLAAVQAWATSAWGLHWETM